MEAVISERNLILEDLYCICKYNGSGAGEFACPGFVNRKKMLLKFMLLFGNTILC